MPLHVKQVMTHRLSIRPRDPERWIGWFIDMSIFVDEIMHGLECGVLTQAGPSGLSGKRMVCRWGRGESVTRRRTEILRPWVHDQGERPQSDSTND